MRIVVKIAVTAALVLALAIGLVHLRDRWRAHEEEAQRQSAEAYFKELLADESRHQAPDVDTLEQPRAADLAWDLERLGEVPGSGAMSLAEHRGKTIFIDVWATWCKPCIAQMPSIQRLYEMHPGDDYAFLLISSEEAEVVEGFLSDQDFTFPVYLTGEAHPETFELSPLPHTYVVNPEGEIVYRKHGGPNRYDDPSFVEFFRSWSRDPSS